MGRLSVEPNTTLFPVPLVLVTCGDQSPNLLTINRVSSCNAEPPMLAISIRPSRYSHDLIMETGEFVVNIPGQEMEDILDYVGVTTGREEDKWKVRGLTPIPAKSVTPPLIKECPVNIECRLVRTIQLPSHTMFISEVVALHIQDWGLNDRSEVDLEKLAGYAYGESVVRERPVGKVDVDALRNKLVENS